MVAAVAAVVMLIVMAGVWFRARRKSVVGPYDTTRTPRFLHHSMYAHFAALMPWMPRTQLKKMVMILQLNLTESKQLAR